ncbi:MAG: hypothetical protein QNJ90_07485 [Planctomycetota bacterium]|nr:hypothetical protein [Planctomycetota bacterium]
MARCFGWLIAIACVALLPGGAAAGPSKEAQASTAAVKARPDLKRLHTMTRGCKEAKALIADLRKRLGRHTKAAAKACDTTDAPPDLMQRFAYAWNELVTLARYHGVKVKPSYVTRQLPIGYWRLLIDVPITPRWRWRWPKEDQHTVALTVAAVNGKPMRKIDLWRYKWDTIYSGVGGENAKKLAQELYKIDRDIAHKMTRKASKKMVAKRLNKHFSRAWYYWAQDFDEKLNAPTKRHNYYIKGKTATFNLEVIDIDSISWELGPVSAWMEREGDPEVAHVLASVRLNPDFGKKKK